MITGLIISIVGYGLEAGVACHCPVQLSGQSFNCHCKENLPQITGHIMSYVGIGIVALGITFFLIGWKKMQSLHKRL